MSIDVINKNPKALRAWIERAKKEAEEYYKKHPDSLIPCFENELRKAGFEFEISNQTLGFMPKHKAIILPIAIKYYQLAKKQNKPNEQDHFMSFFHFKGIEEVVPMLIEDYYSEETLNLTRWFISDCIYQIRSKRFVKEYLSRNGMHDYCILGMNTVKKGRKYSCELQLTDGIETVLITMIGLKALRVDVDFSQYCMLGRLEWGYSEFDITPENTILLSILCDIQNEMQFEFESIMFVKQYA